MIIFRDYRGGSDYGPANKAPYDNLGNLVLLLGSSSGPKIITLVLQAILNYVFVGMPLFKSMSTPRICWYQNTRNPITSNGYASMRIGISTRNDFFFDPLSEVY
jgi:hypothetical protein